ncbi:MAG TPA: class I SAM-dependent methyltransferase [Pseudonocardiaceae bacterium]|jgi:SAM-dependent methyltransferase|nr:class I SAM-dependent methyltransferase [Pseudonocardiaceae bacterium]
MGANSSNDITSHNNTEQYTRERLERGASFGSQAAAYARHRPDYPISAIDWALAPVRARNGLRVLDLAAGTGKLTGVLAAAGVDVVAVEPDAAMLAELTARHPRVEAHLGTAEQIPLPAGAVDAVLVGQALHWFDLDLAYPEIARVLRPGGVLAPLWNTLDDTEQQWVTGYGKLASSPLQSESRTPSSPKHPLFHDFETARFSHSHRRTAEELVSTVATYSHTLVLPPAEQEAKLTEILAYLRAHPETAHGEFDLPLRVLVLRGALR